MAQTQAQIAAAAAKAAKQLAAKQAAAAQPNPNSLGSIFTNLFSPVPQIQSQIQLDNEALAAQNAQDEEEDAPVIAPIVFPAITNSASGVSSLVAGDVGEDEDGGTANVTAQGGTSLTMWITYGVLGLAFLLLFHHFHHKKS